MPRVRIVVVKAWIISVPTSDPISVNRPPQIVPPIMTDARASNSKNSPALFASAPLMSEQIISPAMPEQRPENTYSINLIGRACKPMKRLAFGFAPIASMNMPSAVLRVRKYVSAAMRMTRITGNGKPNRKPPPTNSKES